MNCACCRYTWIAIRTTNGKSSSFLLKLFRGVARIFQRGDHTVSKWGYWPDCHYAYIRTFCLAVERYVLSPKNDEVREAITDANYDLAFLTETWLRDHESSNAFTIYGYNFFRRDRSKDFHGGVCIYINDSIKYEVIDDLFDERLEAIWIKIRPPRPPRGMSFIVISTIYHPQTDKGVSDTEMLNYLYESMTVLSPAILIAVF